MRRQPGIKVLELIPRLGGLPVETFHYRWGVQHAKITQRVEPMERYVQHHRVLEELPGLPPMNIGGITEAWFRSMDAANSGFSNPVFLSEGLASMRRFMDVDAARWMFAEEDVIIDDVDEGHPSARAIIHLRRINGITPDEFAGALDHQ